MVESRENYKFDLGVKGFIKVVKEQVMKLMAIIKQEMQLLRGWQAGKRCGDICAWAKWSIWPELYHHLVSVTWSNWEYCYFPWPPSPPNTSSAFHKISLTVNWYPFLLLGGRRLCKRELCSTSKNTTQWPNQVLSLQTSQPGVNPPSDRSLYLLVGLLDSTFFPNSNPGLIKMLYYQTRGPLLPEEAGLSKRLK